MTRSLRCFEGRHCAPDGSVNKGKGKVPMKRTRQASNGAHKSAVHKRDQIAEARLPTPPRIPSPREKRERMLSVPTKTNTNTHTTAQACTRGRTHTRALTPTHTYTYTHSNSKTMCIDYRSTLPWIAGVLSGSACQSRPNRPVQHCSIDSADKGAVPPELVT